MDSGWAELSDTRLPQTGGHKRAVTVRDVQTPPTYSEFVFLSTLNVVDSCGFHGNPVNSAEGTLDKHSMTFFEGYPQGHGEKMGPFPIGKGHLSIPPRETVP